MEGNDCYRFSTVCNYIEKTAAKPVELALDIGCNLGDVTRLMRSYFRSATIFAFEPVREYYDRACRALGADVNIKVLNAAVCGSHLFKDDLGDSRRDDRVPLKVLKALPDAGPGWVGGSQVVPRAAANPDRRAFDELAQSVVALTLDQAVELACTLAGKDEVDYVKMDCEGCESTSLGCATESTLNRIRFIGGEYHQIARFYEVMRAKLYRTHFVNLIGGRELGSFFCERKGKKTTILEPSRDGMLQLRPWLCDKPIDWHLFREEFVLPTERGSHAL